MCPLLCPEFRTRVCQHFLRSLVEWQGKILFSHDEDLGKLIHVDPDLDEDEARAIQELPIDGVLFSPPDDLLPLTVQKLIDFQLVRGLVDIPFVMATPAGLDSSDLEVFRNGGIAGLMLELTNQDAVAKTNEGIAALPRHRPRHKSREAAVPRIAAGFGLPGQGGGEDDEEGDF